MCTWICEKAPVVGSGKGAQGWFAINSANVAYDHPVHAPLDHAILIDFVNSTMGPSARVAVEMDPQSAMGLVRAILTALNEGALQHGLEGITEMPDLAAPALALAR
jgi:hypothetical protein